MHRHYSTLLPSGFPSPLRWLTGCVVALWLLSRVMGAEPGAAKPSLAGASRGELLARAHCSTCHLFPAPNLLDQKTWAEQTLPRMRVRLGLAPEILARQTDAEALRKTAGFLKIPPLTASEFEAITNFYLTKAPPQPLPQDPRPEIELSLPQFTYERVGTRQTNPATTLVRIVPSEKRFYFGDANARQLLGMDATGGLVARNDVGGIPIQMIQRSEGTYVVSIGSFMPSERNLGSIELWKQEGARMVSKTPVLSELYRTTQAEFADLNGDGVDDLVVCQYGNNVGRFSWFETAKDGTRQEHVLINKSGAIQTEIRDFNGDGLPDIAVLFAQETESLYLLTNQGKGMFSQRVVFQRPPVFGHTGFEMVDFDKDGRLDFLVTNGDNGEYASPLKKYHGIRLYLDRGERYEHVFLYPLNGAFKAVARDFDGDGDLDIAVISFYPDYENSPQESFVYLENFGNLRFRAQTFRECISGRWIVMDVGDLDGDGDLDLVLGSYIRGPTDVPDFLMRDWETVGPSVVILRNRWR